MNSLVRIGIMGAVACGPLLAVANAQGDYYSRDKYEAVTDRAQPEFDPVPVRVGTLIVDTNAEVGVISNSNVFATNADEQSDTILRAGLRGRVTTDWNNHEVSASASAFTNSYSDNDDETNEEYRAGLRGRLDVTRQFALTAGVDAAQRSEGRISQANAVSTNRPVDIEAVTAFVGADYRADRIRWNARLSRTEDDYEDTVLTGTGTVFDQDFRDNVVTRASTRVSYAISPNVAVFTQAEVSDREYDLAPERDSSGYALYGGFDFELQSLIRGDVAVGYFEEDKDNPALEDPSGVAVDGRLQWFPSRLTTVSLNARRSVQDLGLVDSSSATQTRFGGRVDHEVRRNLIVSGFASLSNNEYDDVDRSDDITTIGASATYKLNRNFHTEAFARRTEREVSGADVVGQPSFEADVLGIVLRIYP